MPSEQELMEAFRALPEEKGIIEKTDWKKDAAELAKLKSTLNKPRVQGDLLEFHQLTILPYYFFSCAECDRRTEPRATDFTACGDAMDAGWRSIGGHVCCKECIPVMLERIGLSRCRSLPPEVKHAEIFGDHCDHCEHFHEMNQICGKCGR